VLIMSAAVADFRPVDPAAVKLKKTGRDELTITMEPTPDILSGLAASRSPGQTLVGFAAETGDGAVAYGRDKLTRKGLDAVVVNDVAQAGIGFDTPDNEVTIVTAGGEEHIARRGKDEVAAAILRTVDRLRSTSAAPLGR
jgi:phosphopantothenoylcysteine decarboxylase/phosphopantothenate--cysteine ligase